MKNWLLYFLFSLATCSVIADKGTNLIDMYNKANAHFHNAEYAQALELCKRCRDYANKHNDTSVSNANIYMSLGMVYRQLTFYKDALHCFKKVEPLYIEEHGDDYLWLGKLYNYEGICYMETGDLKRALYYYQKAYPILIKHNDSIELSYTCNNMGVVYQRMLKFSKAVDYYKQSIQFISDKRYAISYHNLAEIYMTQGENAEAEAAFLKAIEVCKKDRAHVYRLADIYPLYGQLLYKMGRHEQSLSFLNKGLEIATYTYGKQNIKVSNIYSRISKYYLQLNNLEQALLYVHKRVYALAKEAVGSNIFKNPSSIPISKIDYFRALNSKANILIALSKRDSGNKEEYLLAAFHTLKLSIENAIEIKRDMFFDESKLDFSEDLKNSYKQMVYVSMRLYEHTKLTQYKEEAFHYAGQSKYNTLLNTILEQEAKEFANIPNYVLYFEKTIKKQLLLYEKFIYDENLKAKPNKQEIDLWQERLFKLYKDNESLLQYIKYKYPKYAKLKYASAVYASEEIMRSLEDDELLLEYLYLDSSIVVFSFTKNKFDFFNINIDSAFNTNLNNVLHDLYEVSKYNVNDNYKQFISSSYKLYNYLLEAPMKNFKGKSLIIVPDGKLNFLPFDIIISEKPSLNSLYLDYWSFAYVLKDYNVRYLFSSSLLMKEKHARVEAKNIAAYVPIYNSKKNPSIDSTILKIWDKCPRLKLTEYMVEKILNRYNTDLFIGEEATESSFKKNMHSYDILHIAMHSHIDSINSLYSKLIFHIPNDTLNDGILNISEIYHLELNAHLAILSSCSSGYGENKKGEGVMSISRAFAYAGCPSIVMSLWPANEEATLKMFSGFYNNLDEGMEKDEALRKAKLDYLQQAGHRYAAPYFWANFVAIGDNSPVIIERRKLNFSYLYIAVAFVILTVGWYRLKMKRRRKLK